MHSKLIIKIEHAMLILRSPIYLAFWCDLSAFNVAFSACGYRVVNFPSMSYRKPNNRPSQLGSIFPDSSILGIKFLLLLYSHTVFFSLFLTHVYQQAKEMSLARGNCQVIYNGKK
jgi:hypothetical protein